MGCSDDEIIINQSTNRTIHRSFFGKSIDYDKTLPSFFRRGVPPFLRDGVVEKKTSKPILPSAIQDD